MNRRSFFGLASLLALCHRARAAGVYTYEKETSLSSGQEKVTIHLPSSAGGTVTFIGATIRSSVAGKFEMLRDGTAPTATAVTPTELNGGASGEARAYYSSNVGSGTHVKYYDLLASIETGIDLPYKNLTPGKNLTIQSPASFTGEVRIFIQWRES